MRALKGLQQARPEPNLRTPRIEYIARRVASAANPIFPSSHHDKPNLPCLFLVVDWPGLSSQAGLEPGANVLPYEIHNTEIG